jgi:hypothetical protein
MILPSPEDGDPLSDRGQAPRHNYLPRRLADPCGRGLRPASPSPLVFVIRQAMRLGLSPTHLPLRGSGS